MRLAINGKMMEVLFALSVTGLILLSISCKETIVETIVVTETPTVTPVIPPTATPRPTAIPLEHPTISPAEADRRTNRAAFSEMSIRAECNLKIAGVLRGMQILALDGGHDALWDPQSSLADVEESWNALVGQLTEEELSLVGEWLIEISAIPGLDEENEPVRAMGAMLTPIIDDLEYGNC